MLLEHCIRRAASLAAWTAGSSNPTNTPMMAMTTNNSTSVKPALIGFRMELSASKDLQLPGDFISSAKHPKEPRYGTSKSTKIKYQNSTRGGGVWQPKVFKKAAVLKLPWKSCVGKVELDRVFQVVLAGYPN
jgi:hypothetical protein